MQENVKIDELEAHPENDKIYSKQDLTVIKQSISNIGIITPIIITPGKRILSGHTRVLACKELGIKEIPALVKDIPEEEEVHYLIASNIQREKKWRDKAQEVIKLSEFYGKKQGARNDLYDYFEEKPLNTRTQIAQDLKISEGNIPKLQKILSVQPQYFDWIDKKAITLNEAYNRCLRIEKGETPKRPEDLEKKKKSKNSTKSALVTCTHCGESFNVNLADVSLNKPL